jgi:uncharacterized membrane protein
VRRRIVLLVIAVVVLAWTAAIVAAPAVSARGGRGGARLAAVMYVAGSLICHQRPERSFHVGAAQLPVCARCLGLYAGGALGVLVWIAFTGLGRRPSARAAAWLTRVRVVLITAAIPTLISVITAWLGVWDPGNVLRATLALPLGAAAGAVVAAVSARDLE